MLKNYLYEKNYYKAKKKILPSSNFSEFYLLISP